METLNLIKEIHSTVKKITNDTLTSLRMEEELLYLVVRDQKHLLDIKVAAYKRIAEINKLQQELLGHKIGA